MGTLNLMGDLPLVNNRQTPSIESREVYNVKSRGYEWASPGKTWRVDVGKVVNHQINSDQVLLDHVLKKSRTHNEYFPRHQSKVNKNWRMWKIDLDREQYNHLRIPVNHSVSWMAPTFERRADKEQKCAEETVIEDKYINKEHRSKQVQATPIERISMPHDVNIPDMLDVNYVQKCASIRHNRREQGTPIDFNETMFKDKQEVYIGSGMKGITKQHTQGTPIDVKIVEERPTYTQSTGIRRKGMLGQVDVNPDVKLADTLQVNIKPNIKSYVRKDTMEFDTTKEIQENLLQASIEMLKHKNRQMQNPSQHTLPKSIYENVGEFEVLAGEKNFDRYVPLYGAIRSN